MHAEVKEMPEYHVAYVRKMGPYGKETCEQGFAELMQWAGPEGHLATGAVLSIFWDNPEVTTPEKCRTDVCVAVAKGTVTRGQVGIQTISGGQYAACRFEIGVEEFSKAWNRPLVGWLPAAMNVPTAHATNCIIMMPKSIRKASGSLISAFH